MILYPDNASVIRLERGAISLGPLFSEPNPYPFDPLHFVPHEDNPMNYSTPEDAAPIVIFLTPPGKPKLEVYANYRIVPHSGADGITVSGSQMSAIKLVVGACNGNKVTAIKTIRTLTGWDLARAKWAVDALEHFDQS